MQQTQSNPVSDVVTANALFEALNRLRLKGNESKCRRRAAWREVRLHPAHVDGKGYSNLNTPGGATSVQSDFMHVSILAVKRRSVIWREH